MTEGVRGVFILLTLENSRWAKVTRILREIARIHRTPDNPGESPDYPDPVHNLSQGCFFVEILSGHDLSLILFVFLEH